MEAGYQWTLKVTAQDPLHSPSQPVVYLLFFPARLQSL